MELSYSAITILLPLLMFFVLGLLGTKLSKTVAGILGTGAMLVTTIIAYSVALTYFFDPQYTVDGIRQPVEVFNYVWLTLGNKLTVDMGILMDPIAARCLSLLQQSL